MWLVPGVQRHLPSVEKMLAETSTGVVRALIPTRVVLFILGNASASRAPDAPGFLAAQMRAAIRMGAVRAPIRRHVMPQGNVSVFKGLDAQLTPPAGLICAATFMGAAKAFVLRHKRRAQMANASAHLSAVLQ